jgi:hypothetical protein
MIYSCNSKMPHISIFDCFIHVLEDTVIIHTHAYNLHKGGRGRVSNQAYQCHNVSLNMLAGVPLPLWTPFWNKEHGILGSLCRYIPSLTTDVGLEERIFYSCRRNSKNPHISIPIYYQFTHCYYSHTHSRHTHER